MSGNMLPTKNFTLNVTFGGKTWITGKPRGGQNTMIIAFGEVIVFLGLVDWKPLLFAINGDQEHITRQEVGPAAMFRRPRRDAPRFGQLDSLLHHCRGEVTGNPPQMSCRTARSC
jgi:hypothetical protein